MSGGRWLLLLDAFDETPALLERTASEVLTLARAGSDEGMTELLAAGFRASSWLCGCRSFEQAMRLPVLPRALIAPMREALVARGMTRTPEPGGPSALRRRLVRLDPTRGLIKALGLVRFFERIDHLWYATVFWLIVGPWGLYFLVFGLGGGSAAIGKAIVVLACALLLMFGPLVVPVTMRSRDRSSISSLDCLHRNASECIWRNWLLPVVVFRGLHVVWFLLLFLLARHGVPLPVADGDPWVLVPIPTGLVLNWQLFSRVLIILGGGIAILMPWTEPPGSSGPDLSLWLDGPYLPFIFASISLIVLELRAQFLAWLALLSSAPITAQSLLNSGTRRYAISGGFGRHDKLTWGLKNLRLVADQGAVAIIVAAIQAIERDIRRRARQPRRWSPLARWRSPRPEPDASWPEDVKNWYRSHARRGNGVAYLDGLVLHDLIQLRDALRARLAAQGT